MCRPRLRIHRPRSKTPIRTPCWTWWRLRWPRRIRPMPMKLPIPSAMRSASPSHSLPSLGVARTFQNIELFAGATVLSNILLGCQVHRRTGLISELLFTPRVFRQEIAFRDRVENIIAFLDLGTYRDVEVASLPYGIRKTVELARALAIGPKLLLLDEPSSGLNAEETHHVSQLILGIRDRFETAVVMVEHDMNLVNNISDRVLALVAGRVLAEGTPEEIRNNTAVKSAYLGDS